MSQLPAWSSAWELGDVGVGGYEVCPFDLVQHQDCNVQIHEYKLNSNDDVLMGTGCVQWLMVIDGNFVSCFTIVIKEI